ncbi:MAG: flippase-like domain-containing protein [Bacteroidales bacterium]|nr:flippase-like domain-containing protein [Bacteroidales bacterium]
MAKLNKTYNILIRLGILILTFYYLYDQLIFEHNLSDLSVYFQLLTEKKSFPFIITLIVVLLPVNLLLESFKWQLLINKLEKISLGNALKAVLAGISVSMFMPNRVGDYLGRIFILKKANRIQATLSTILGSIAQFLTTLIFGIVASVLFFPYYMPLTNSLNFWIYVGVILTAAFTLLIIVFFYLNFSAFSNILKRFSGKAHNRISRYTEVFSWYNAAELFHILLLSIIRYLVFSFQFYLFLRLFGITLDYFHSMMLIGIIYLLVSGIPTIALSELGVRGSVSLYVFQLYFGTQIMAANYSGEIVSASSALWFINLALPALVGIIFIFNLKFFRNQ